MEKIFLGGILIFTLLIWIAILLLGHEVTHELYVICMHSGAKGC